MKTYIGRPCKLGHTVRYISDTKCVECKRLYAKTPARRKYGREYAAAYRIAHPEYAERQRAASKAYTARRRLDPLLRAKWNTESNERNYVKKYGITREEKLELLASQNGACALCGTTAPKTFRPWHLDHDHNTGKVRGVLCHHCNVGLGGFRDDPEIAERAAAYLRKYQ